MTKEKLDLGKSFEKMKGNRAEWLLNGLVKADKILSDLNNEYRYPEAFGVLKGSITSFLFCEHEIDYYEYKEQGDGKNDISEK